MTGQVAWNTQVSHASGGGDRWIHVDGRPAFDAGNRYNLDPETAVSQSDPSLLWKLWAAKGAPIAGL